MKYHSNRLSILGSLHMHRNLTPHGHWKWLDIRNCKGDRSRKEKHMVQKKKQGPILLKRSPHLPTMVTAAASLYFLLSRYCPTVLLTKQFCNEWEHSERFNTLPPCHNHLHITPQKYKPASKLCSALRTHYTVQHFGSDMLLLCAFPEWTCHQSVFLQMSIFCQWPNDSHSRQGKD